MFSERYKPTKYEAITKDSTIKRLRVGNRQRCLTCKIFVVKIAIGSKARFSNLQPIDKPYKHAADCPQIGRF